jgi:ABC-type glycerol-3-phosphate transport system substrate-binding protein
MKTLKALLLVMLAAILLLVAVTSAGAGANTRITWYAISYGGGHAHSPNYTLDATTGQAAPGLSHSPNFQLGGGFWYALGVPEVAEIRIFLPVLLKRYP